MAGTKDIHGFVLAGGESTRMGEDKALMSFEGEPLVLRAAGLLRPFVGNLHLLAPAGRYENLGQPVIADGWPGEGPLGAICTGLLASPAGWNLFVACDLPLLSARFIQHIIERIRRTDAVAVVPRTTDGWQPLSAAYHQRCRAAFLRDFQEGERSVIALLDKTRVEVVTPGEMAAAGVSEEELANMNSPEDWAKFTEFAKGGR